MASRPHSVQLVLRTILIITVIGMAAYVVIQPQTNELRHAILSTNASTKYLIKDLGIHSLTSASVSCPVTAADWLSWKTLNLQNLFAPESMVTGLTQLESCAPALVPKSCASSFLQSGKTLKSFVSDRGETMSELGSAMNVLTPTDLDGVNDLAPGFVTDDIYALLALNPRNSEVFVPAVNLVLSKAPPGTVAISYTSSLSLRPGLIFATPGAEMDRYIHLDIYPGEQLMIALTIEKKNRAGDVLKNPRPFFNTLVRSGGQIVKGQASTMTRCMICHQSGLMPITAKTQEPVVAYGTEMTSETALNWFNNKLAAETGNALVPGLDKFSRGPQIGPVNDPGRTEAFMKDCIGRSHAPADQVRVDRVKQAMNCAACHTGGEGTAVVSYPFNPKSFNDHAVLDNFINLGMMPPQSNNEKNLAHFLNPFERTALLTCLKSEFFGGFNDVKLGGSSGLGTYLSAFTAKQCQ